MYAYDQGGNITCKTAYAYTTGTVGSAVKADTYTYGDSNWKDKLTAYNGVTINYDAIGNPISDGTWSYTWEKGRQLKSMSKAGETATFTYNADGLRIKKVCTSTGTTNYTLCGKSIVHLENGSNNLHFFYDVQNRPALVVFNGTAYGYVHNLQGDIIAVVNSAGTKVVEYAYDAWGKPLSKSGSMASTLGTLSPFRYRGYIYDEETNLYYLRNRYYMLETKRMLNADIIFIGNLYSYCKNSPIRRVDTDGCIDYATIGAGVDLFQLIYDQEAILGDVTDYLAEQKRIIDSPRIRYNWDGQSDSAGYSCATFISKPLQKISRTKENKGKFIRSHTGIGSMLRNSGGHMLFIARLSDYDLREIPVGASFLRPAGYNGAKYGHGATYAKPLGNNMLTINHAKSASQGIVSEDLSYEDLCKRFEYIAWPVGLGTTEENPDWWLVVDDEED